MLDEDVRSGSPGDEPSGGFMPSPSDKQARSIPLSRAALMTTKEASAFLGYRSDRRLWNLRAALRGPKAIKLPAGGVRYRIEDLEEWAVTVSVEGEPDLRGLAHSRTEAAKKEQRRALDLERQRARRAVAQEGRP